MRTLKFLFLCLLLNLTACAAPGSMTGEPRVPADTPLKSLAQPTIAPAVVQPTAAPTAATPAAAPKFESSVPLYLWNEAQRQYEIHLVDPATGQDVPGYTPFIVGKSTDFSEPNTLSTNGQKMAIVAANSEYCYASGGGTACMGRADMLHLIDRPAWREVTATLPGKGWAGPISFSPDATRLALIYNEPKSSAVMLFDTSTGNLVAQQGIAFQPSLMGYTQDGTTLMLYGQPSGSDPGISKPDPPRVVLMDATILEIKWEQQLPSIASGYWCLEKCDAPHGEQTFADWTPAVVLSPDGHKLYIVAADEEQLTTVDFDTRTVRNVEIQAAQSWFDRLLALTAGVAEAKGGVNGAFKAGVLSPDGTRLYMVGRTMKATRDANGNWQGTEASLGFQVIDVENGRKIASRDSEATWIKITRDGTYLLLGSPGEGGWVVEVLDANSLQSVAGLTKWEVVATRRMDGQPIILASYQPSESLTRLAMLDPRSFEITHSWSVDTYASWVAIP